MVGIVAFGAYIPRYRLGADTAGWNSKLERSIANFDEDSVTMGVAAGVDGIFVEAHPHPPDALCDAASQYYLDDLEEFLTPLIEIHQLVRKLPH